MSWQVSHIQRACPYQFPGCQLHLSLFLTLKVCKSEGAIYMERRIVGRSWINEAATLVYVSRYGGDVWRFYVYNSFFL